MSAEGDQIRVETPGERRVVGRYGKRAVRKVTEEGRAICNVTRTVHAT